MSQKILRDGVALLGCGVMFLSVSSCSKDKEGAVAVVPAGDMAAPISGAPATEGAPAVGMKEPGEVLAPLATATGVVKVRARFDGYAARVSKGLWQPVRLAPEVANFGLITPMEAVSASSGLVVEGGPEGLAVGTPAGTLQTVDGRPLLAGREYAFAFSKGAGEIWSVEITVMP